MSFREICERRDREIHSWGFGQFECSYMDKMKFGFVRHIDPQRVMYTRPRYNGEAMDNIIGTMYQTEAGLYHIGTDCEVTHYTEDDVTTIVGISFCNPVKRSNRMDDDLKIVLAVLREKNAVDLGCFPYYELKGF